MVWCGVVWGVVWCGVVWCGVVWCGVVWGVVLWCVPCCGGTALCSARSHAAAATTNHHHAHARAVCVASVASVRCQACVPVGDELGCG